MGSDVDTGSVIVTVSHNDSALAIAVASGSVPIILALLSKGATSMDARKCVRASMSVPMKVSVWWCMFEPLNAGADLSRQNDLGNTALMKACNDSSCTVEVCGILVRAVCDTHVPPCFIRLQMILTDVHSCLAAAW